MVLGSNIGDNPRLDPPSRADVLSNIMSGNGMLVSGMHSYERSLTQHELSRSLLSLSPAIDVRSQTHSQDVAPILVGTMTTRLAGAFSQSHRHTSQAPAAFNSNSPRAW